MREIAAAGIGTVIASWWGQGSVEDRRLPRVIAAARAHGLAVAAHLEPYRRPDRRVDGGGHRLSARARDPDFYVWASVWLPDAEWAELNARLEGVRTFANTNLAGRAAAGGFDGLYTYDVLLFDGGLFPRLCAQARRLGLLCAPSVGPGYDARRATGDTRVRSRRNGATYDAMWRGAMRAARRPRHDHELQRVARGHADRAGARRPARLRGLRRRVGNARAAAERAYLDRTAYWVRRFSG